VATVVPGRAQGVAVERDLQHRQASGSPVRAGQKGTAIRGKIAMNNVVRTVALATFVPLALGACQRPLDVGAEARAVSPGEPVVLTIAGNTVPAGTRVHARLDQTLSTQSAEPGDRFTMTLETPVHNANHQVLVPRGTRLEGTVTAVRAATDAAAPAVLRLELNSIVMAGHTMPLGAEIVEATPERTGVDVGDAAAGAAAGAVLGAVVGTIIRGNTQGALQGAAIGAGAGTIIALGTARADARLESGSMLTLRLTQPLATHR
jgi:hypothetical protein